MGPTETLLAWAAAHPELLPPVGYRIRKIDWVLNIGAEAAAVTPYGESDAVPAMRRSGTKPAPLLAVDTAAYVLGCSGKGATAKQATERAGTFWSQMGQWAATDRHPAVVAGLAMLQYHEIVASGHDMQPGDRVAIRVEGVWLHRLPEAVAYWESTLVRTKGGPTGLCIGCRTHTRLAATLPNSIPAHLLPGAEQEVQMFVLPKDERIRGGNLPVCVPCGDRASAALQALLDDGRRTARAAKQDSVTVVYGVGAAGADEAVVALLREIGA